MEATKELDQRYVNGTTEDCFIFCYWFDSKSSTEAAMGVCADIIDIFKFWKDNIDNTKKGFPVVYYLVLKKNYMMPRGLTLIAIGYKYNARKDLSFIATEYTGGA